MSWSTVIITSHNTLTMAPLLALLLISYWGQLVKLYPKLCPQLELSLSEVMVEGVLVNVKTV